MLQPYFTQLCGSLFHHRLPALRAAAVRGMGLALDELGCGVGHQLAASLEDVIRAYPAAAPPGVAEESAATFMCDRSQLHVDVDDEDDDVAIMAGAGLDLRLDGDDDGDDDGDGDEVDDADDDDDCDVQYDAPDDDDGFRDNRGDSRDATFPDDVEGSNTDGSRVRGDRYEVQDDPVQRYDSRGGEVNDGDADSSDELEGNRDDSDGDGGDGEVEEFRSTHRLSQSAGQSDGPRPFPHHPPRHDTEHVASQDAGDNEWAPRSAMQWAHDDGDANGDVGGGPMPPHVETSPSSDHPRGHSVEQLRDAAAAAAGNAEGSAPQSEATPCLSEAQAIQLLETCYHIIPSLQRSMVKVSVYAWCVCVSLCVWKVFADPSRLLIFNVFRRKWWPKPWCLCLRRLMWQNAHALR